MSPRQTFERELKDLQEQIREMAYYLEEAYEKLFYALKKEDQAAMHEIKSKNKLLSDMQRNIESKCLFLITKQQPIVGDLRVVSASLKVVTDMERVGDHIIDMAELLLRNQLKPLELYSKHLIPMTDATKVMLHNSMNAFVERSIEEAREAIVADDTVDELFNLVKQDLIVLLSSDKQDTDECVDILMLAKYLEKIGDHAVNIGEWEIFQETGNMKDNRLL